MHEQVVCRRREVGGGILISCNYNMKKTVSSFKETQNLCLTTATQNTAIKNGPIIRLQYNLHIVKFKFLNKSVLFRVKFQETISIKPK